MRNFHSDQFLKKELEANKKRTEALKFLSKHGISLDSKPQLQGSSSTVLELDKKPSGDNTLYLMRQEAVAKKRNIIETQAKQALLAQQRELRTSATIENKSQPLKEGWESVLDPSSGQTYYWNKLTNETTWIRPSSSEPSQVLEPVIHATQPNQSLPNGWEERIHAATKQVYYYHPATGKSSHTMPTSGCETSDPKSNNSSNIPVKEAAEKNFHPSLSTIHRSEKTFETYSKKRKFDLDMLDPTNDSHSKQGYAHHTQEKMADSTASGPLWQQRPYPAPSQVLKNKSAAATGIGPSSHTIGPAFHAK